MTIKILNKQEILSLLKKANQTSQMRRHRKSLITESITTYIALGTTASILIESEQSSAPSTKLFSLFVSS